MTQLREIHWPDEPQQGDIHSEGGRTWEYTLMPGGSSVNGVWRDVGCKEVTGSGPGWDLESIKDLLGIEGEDFDDQIAAAMKVTMAFIERYCNRLFEWRDNHTELQLPVKGNGWQLRLWPVSGDIYVDDTKTDFLMDNERGVIWFPSYNYENFRTLQYSGGYKSDEWPADLLQVLYNAIKNQWEITINNGSVSSQDVSRITIPDVGTITYANNSSSAGEIGMGADFGPVSQVDQILLSLYRLHEC